MRLHLGCFYVVFADEQISPSFDCILPVFYYEFGSAEIVGCFLKCFFI
jgi:hypothetical protein